MKLESALLSPLLTNSGAGVQVANYFTNDCHNIGPWSLRLRCELHKGGMVHPRLKLEQLPSSIHCLVDPALPWGDLPWGALPLHTSLLQPQLASTPIRPWQSLERRSSFTYSLRSHRRMKHVANYCTSTVEIFWKRLQRRMRQANGLS